jgi:hypothetical protein
MKLRGKWVTVNSITRFVRDPDPIKPRKARKPRKKKKRRKLRLDRIPGRLYSVQPKVHAYLKDHNLLERRRAAGDYDTPKLTAYALNLIADHETPGDLLVNPLPSGCRMKGFQVPLEDSSFISFYLLGSATAAGNPRRPCDHSGIC